jgi:hypothetical protein
VLTLSILRETASRSASRRTNYLANAGYFPTRAVFHPIGTCFKSKPGSGVLLPASGFEAVTVAIKQALENLRVQRAVDLIERLGNFHAFRDHKRDIEKLRRRIAARDLIANLIPALEF